MTGAKPNGIGWATWEPDPMWQSAALHGEAVSEDERPLGFRAVRVDRTLPAAIRSGANHEATRRHTMTLERQRVPYTDMRDFIRLLDEKGLVHHVTAEVDPVLEIGAVAAARSLERQGPAIIFRQREGATRTKPMVVNLLSTIEQVALAFGTEPDEAKIHERVVSGMDHRLPSVQVDSGPCKEVIVSGDDIDLDFIPTPLWHEHDGGQYLATTAGVVTRDPITGILNIGLYRAMIKDKQTLSLSGGIRGRESSTGPGGGRPHPEQRG